MLTNAVKYTDEQGQISLEAEPLDGRVTITVRDSGIGIPPDMLNQIFVPFTQVSQSVDRAQGGLGIGLALVRSLVEMHGGTVTAHSEGAGKGSQFVVRLSTIAYMATPEPVVPKAPPAASRRVLVVDDNQNAAETLSSRFAVFASGRSSILAVLCRESEDVLDELDHFLTSWALGGPRRNRFAEAATAQCA